uniref:Rho termination factor, N-terminal domain, F-box domain and Ankyrin repeat protein n=1 Tax=Pithovirus LCPAC304 TaxID=2506594 RepID=A0A481ZA86_9VIRU|nr:MAG: Rho termination factor, N-terminal domain, F-box domain and Ankyrin repeat protein [Pithovirus LCPAC304]
MDLSDLTVVNLRKLAKENGLKGYYGLRKAELIDFLETNLSFERRSSEEEVFLETEIDPKHEVFDLMELDYELRVLTLAQLRYPDLMRFCATSRAASEVCVDNYFWEVKTRRDFGAEHAYPPWPRENWEADYRFYLQELEPELMDAVRRGNAEKVRELAEFGVDVNSRDTMTPLIRAAYDGSVEIATILLENGADVDAKTTRHRFTALYATADQGNVKMVKLLLDYGADAQATSRTGTEPIFTAAWNSSSIELVDMLLEAGGNINNTNETNMSLLSIASAIPNRGAYIQALIDRGANIDIRETTQGLTPLLTATRVRRPENVRVLLENGADSSIRDNRRRTALHIARRRGYPNPAIREMLEERRRDVSELRETIRTIIVDQGGVYKATKRSVRTKLRTIVGQEFIKPYRNHIDAIIVQEARNMDR